ncbi:helix-turn-helix domain-containing protein [Altererythrobacter sp.]|uniref:AraC family transcriptional regulator n=1 Tax=Altererythrobacter sp. TaxID=1872480 RepID=UPI003CFCFD06
MIETLDSAVRLIATGASLLLLTLLLAGQVRRPIKIALAGLLAGAVAYLLNSSPAFRLDWPYHHFIDLMSLFTPFWVWIFARRLFEREPPQPLIWGIVVLLGLSWFAGAFVPQTDPIGFYAIHILSLGLVADLFIAAFTGRADDLVERRRLVRLWLPILFAAQSGGILLFESIIGRAIPYPPIQLINSLLILALAMFSGFVLLRTDPELLVETERDHPAPPDAAPLSPSETVLQEKLEQAMSQGYYRTPGLTIAALAQHLGTPEHRLRALINRRLGHRNFSAFLNRHRIAEARAKLADKADVNLPVLTIAMDLGYNSLPTFNRAFRAETGMTPTDYRRDALGAEPASP